MASPNFYSRGIGGATGASLVSLYPLLTSGTIWYVQSTTGTDAASPAGQERIKPLATLAQAHTNASAGDLIVCMQNHSEVLTGAQSFNKAGIMLLGEGTGANIPRFTRNGDVNMFDVSVANFYIDNIYFVASSSASAKSRLRIAGSDSRVYRCYFECGANDTGPALEYITGASDALVKSTTFASTLTSTASQPNSAIKVTNAITGLEMDTVTMDGNGSGWSNPYAFNGAAAITRLWASNMTLLNSSDWTLATGTSGFIHTIPSSARVVWAA